MLFDLGDSELNESHLFFSVWIVQVSFAGNKASLSWCYLTLQMQAGPALNFVRSNIIKMELDLIKNLSTTKTNSGFGELESLFKDSFFQKRVGLRVFGGEMLLFLLCAGEGISVIRVSMVRRYI